MATILAFLLAIMTCCLSSPITNPLLGDENLDKVIPEYFDSKKFRAYHNTTPVFIEDIPFIRQYNIDPLCVSKSLELKLRWSTTLGSSVFAHPVIFPSGADGKKQVFLSTFYDYVELLGYDGFKPWGWPLSFEGSSFQGSPMLYDIDGDGKNDVGVVDKNGNMYWIRIGEFGQYLEDYHIQVPKLKIVRDWSKNLDPSFVDNYVLTSMFDHRHGRVDAEADGQNIFKKDIEKKSVAKVDSLDLVPKLVGKGKVASGQAHSRRLSEIVPDSENVHGVNDVDGSLEGGTPREIDSGDVPSSEHGESIEDLEEQHIGDDYVARDHLDHV